jgi:hypothetical protein
MMMPVYQQPVMMAQPMMMAPQPMMQQQQFQQQQPQIVINNNNDDDGDCPQCKKGVMIAEKTCTCKTCCLCIIFAPSLLCDCAWGTKRKCLSCGYDVNI